MCKIIKEEASHKFSLSYSLTVSLSLSFQSSLQIYSLILFYLKHVNITHSSFLLEQTL